MHWQTTRFSIPLDRPRIMGIVNVTPDSFSDGGQHASCAAALAHCEQLVADGADLLDQELARVLPVLREAMKLGVPISVDTCKPDVMQAALAEGADIINDIWALRRPGARQVVARHPGCGVCLMHMHGEPRTMQRSPMEGDAVPQVLAFLQRETAALLALGVQPERIVWDAGIGFGKTVEQNFALLARQAELAGAGYPLLAAWSRKSSLGTVTGLPLQERLAPSLAAALLAVERGARIVRVHDVKETAAVLKVWAATIDSADKPGSGSPP
jgi:dihydropteroate synthase